MQCRVASYRDDVSYAVVDGGDSQLHRMVPMRGEDRLGSDSGPAQQSVYQWPLRGGVAARRGGIDDCEPFGTGALRRFIPYRSVHRFPLFHGDGFQRVAEELPELLDRSDVYLLIG